MATSINRVCRGKRNTYAGFTWEYLEQKPFPDKLPKYIYRCRRSLRVEIQRQGKKHYIGGFRELDKAIAARDKWLAEFD